MKNIIHVKNNRITAAELSTQLGICRSVISKLTKAGMPCVYFGTKASPGRGSRPRYDIEEVKAWLKSRNKTANE